MTASSDQGEYVPFSGSLLPKNMIISLLILIITAYLHHLEAQDNELGGRQKSFELGGGKK